MLKKTPISKTGNCAHSNRKQGALPQSGQAVSCRTEKTGYTFKHSNLVVSAGWGYSTHFKYGYKFPERHLWRSTDQQTGNQLVDIPFSRSKPFGLFLLAVSFLKDRVLEFTPATIVDLKAAVDRHIQNIPLQVCRNVTFNCQRRLAACSRRKLAQFEHILHTLHHAVTEFVVCTISNFHYPSFFQHFVEYILFSFRVILLNFVNLASCFC